MANGRFVNKSVAEDDRLGKLSAMAEFIFLKTIPHLDRDGMITGKPGLLFSKTHPLREELFGQTQKFIDEWVAVGLVILFNTPEGPALFFPGFAKNNRLPHYEREQPSRFPPPPGFAHGELGLYPAHKSPPTKAPKKPKGDAAPSEDVKGQPDYIVGNPPFGHDKELDEVMDEVQDVLQDSVLDEVQELLQDAVDELQALVPFLGAEVEVKDQDQVEEKNKNNNNNALRVLTLAEAEKAVVVVGVDSLIAEMDDNQTMALLSWLWLYNGWFEEDFDYRDNFRRAYGKHDPFAGMKQPAGVMVAQAKVGRPAPLKEDDRAEMMLRLRQLQEAQP